MTAFIEELNRNKQKENLMKEEPIDIEEEDIAEIMEFITTQMEIRQGIKDSLIAYGTAFTPPPKSLLEDADTYGVINAEKMVHDAMDAEIDRREKMKSEPIEPEPKFELLTILLSNKEVTFTGRYRRDLEKPQWHYYETEEGKIMHFRKSAMQGVLEGNDYWCIPNA